MKILMVSPGVWPIPSAGGAENVVYQLTNNLARLGCEVDLVSDVDETAHFHPKISIHPVRLPHLSFYNSCFLGYAFRHAIGGWYAFKTARRLLKNRYNAVHVHGRLAPFLISFFVKENLVYTVHDDPPQKGASHYLIYRISYKLLTEGTAKRASRVITLHPRMKDYLVEIGVSPEKIVSIPNGVDTEIFKPYLGRKGEYCLYVGSLIPRKGVNYLLHALAKLDDLSCLIVGDGTERRSLVSLTQKLGIENRIRFLGTITDPEKLARLYSAASFFLLPSLSESFPLVIPEAMSCATPVIASRLPGPAAIIRDGNNGFLVEPGDVEDLAQKMRILKDSPKLREQMGKEGLAPIRSEYCWESIAKKTLKLYEKIVSEKRR